MTLSEKEKWSAWACLLASLMCFSIVPIFLRYLATRTSLDSWTVNGVRYGVAALFWAPFVYLVMWRAEDADAVGRDKSIAAPPVRRVWIAALIPASANLVGQSLWALCPYFVPASVIGFAFRLTFFFTILLSFIILKEERRLASNRWFYVGAVSCVVGIITMFIFKLAKARESLGEDEGVGLAALALILSACFFMSAYAVTVRRFMSEYSTRLSFGVVSLYTVAGLLVIMLLAGDYGELSRLNAKNWIVLIVSGMIGITFAHVLYYRVIHHLGPIIANGVMMISPFVTLLLAMRFLGERMSANQFIGGLLVVAGGVALLRARSQLKARS